MSCNISRGSCIPHEVFVDIPGHYRDPKVVEGVIAQELVYWYCLGARTGHLGPFGLNMAPIWVLKALWTRSVHYYESLWNYGAATVCF